MVIHKVASPEFASQIFYLHKPEAGPLPRLSRPYRAWLGNYLPCLYQGFLCPVPQ